MLSFSNVVMLIQTLPAVVQAVQQILASDAAKSLEQAVADVINHVTPGRPNSPALAPEATPVVVQQ